MSAQAPSGQPQTLPLARSKPKFQPKLVKKAETPGESNDRPPAQAPVRKERDPTQQRDRSGQQHRNGPGRGGLDGGRGFDGQGRGRGRSVAPVGTAFFRGNQSAAPPRIPTGHFGSGSSSFSSSSSSSSTAAAAAAVAATTADVMDEDGVVIKSEESGTSLLRIKKEIGAGRGYDSDSDHEGFRDPLTVAAAASAAMEDENGSSWPPIDVDPLAPLELPIGPPTAAIRSALDRKPLFASPDDPIALEDEESFEMFLLQLPSDLRLPRHEMRLNNGNSGSDLTSENSNGKLKAGKIGKLVMTRSGAVHFLGEDGRKYAVNQGMTCAFSQYAAAITLDPAATIGAGAGSIPPSSTSSSSSGGVSIKTESNTAAVYKGSCHFLGSVSRKLVLVPEFEIGFRRGHDDEDKIPGVAQQSSSKSRLRRAFAPAVGASVAGSAAAPTAAAAPGTRPERSTSIGTEISETEYDARGPDVGDAGGYMSDD